MKTLVLLSSLAAIVAFAFIPISFDTAVSLLFVAGLALVVVCDYRREIRPLRVAAAKVRTAPRTEHLGLAA